MEMQLPEDFKESLRLLNSAEVEYLLIGGFAVGYYGYPRATNDIDVWVSRTETNAAKHVATLEEFGFGTPELEPELFQKPDLHLKRASELGAAHTLHPPLMQTVPVHLVV